jgi:hypothetical protein
MTDAGLMLMNPLILNDPINGSERGEFDQHSGEALDQWPQAGLWHQGLPGGSEQS